MLLAGALTLVVPLVGWQSVKQLYSALQQNRIDEQTLKVANMRLALAETVSVSEALLAGNKVPSAHDWYAESAQYPNFLDGYADDWKTLLHPALVYRRNSVGARMSPVKELAHEVAASPVPIGMNNEVFIRASTTKDSLHIFISVVDNEVVYHEIPPVRVDAGETERPDRWQNLVNGDAIELLIEQPSGRWEHGVFRALAPGPITALSASDELMPNQRIQKAGSVIARWQAQWQESVSGYQLEIQMPLPANGARVGFSVVDIDERGESRHRWLGSTDSTIMASLRKQVDVDDALAGVFYVNQRARSKLQGWTTNGMRSRLFDVHGRLVSDVNKLYSRDVLTDQDEAESASGKGILNALLFRLFSFMVAGDLPLLPETRSGGVSLSLDQRRRDSITDDQPLTSRYVTQENDRVLGTLVPIGSQFRRGYLLMEANEEHVSAYAGSQLAQLFSLLLLVSLLAGCGLLVFAIVLSSRIRRLSYQAGQAISEDGRVHGLPGSDARDEIGDLSRNLSSLLSRSAAYTQHLEALSSRLAHELRTPLSVVRTSIENLDDSALDEQSRVLVARASSGADRLSRIIKALVESTRLEQSIQTADKQLISLNEWLVAVARMYRQIYPQYSIICLPDVLPELHVRASPELMQQAMDKLVANAASFNQGNDIVLHLTLDDSANVPKAMLSVSNKGQLPEGLVQGNDWAQLFDPLVSRREHDLQAANSDELNLGLGLYIVRLIAEHSAGEVFALQQSDRVSVGFSIPAIKPNSGPT